MKRHFERHHQQQRTYLPAMTLILVAIIALYITLQLLNNSATGINKEIQRVKYLSQKWEILVSSMEALHSDRTSDCNSLLCFGNFEQELLEFIKEQKKTLELVGYSEERKENFKELLGLYSTYFEQGKKPENPEILTLHMRQIEELFNGYIKKQDRLRHLFSSLLNVSIAALLFVILLIFYRFRKILETRENLEFLAQAMERDRESKREDLALEIHDTVIQDLASLKLQLKKENNLSEESSTRISRMTNHLRTICHNIYPANLSTLSLQDNINQLIMDLKKRSDIQVELSILGLEKTTLPYDLSKVIYRVVRELVRNCEKHSSAANLLLQILYNSPYIYVRIEDNGKGFHVKRDLREAVKAGHIGLASISEQVKARNGEIRIQFFPGQGTSIRIRLENENGYE